MIRNKIILGVLILILCGKLNYADENLTTDRVGWWNFNDTTNLVAPVSGYGLPLELVGSHQSVEGPALSDFAAKIGVGSYYKMRHQISANGGGSKVNEYTLQIDFKVEALGVWHCFFQTTILNNNDGDCFINPSGNIGVAATGYSNYLVKPNEWYRLVLSVKNGTQYKYYLDGELLNNGTVQAIDGRFSLDSLLLMFDDDDGEDNNIIVSEIGIWDRALSGAEINTLGGFGHKPPSVPGTQLILVPYLQEPTTNSMYVCWHDTMAASTSVEYGTTSSLGQSVSGTSEIVGGAYRWHSVKLTGLQPNTEYFYKAVSGSGASPIYTFKTLPDSNYKGKIRFLLLSDTHSSDTTMAVKVIKEAKKKVQQLYGSDIQNQINVVLHSGDLVVDGSNIVQWTDQFFAPMSPISPNIPFMTVAGNHEAEHQNYYKYMKYDDVQPYTTAGERFWSIRIANTLFIGLNSNASSFYTLQKIWLDQALAQAEADSSIDFVFVMSHHFSITELWGEGMTYEAFKVQYVTNEVYPILKKYSKVVQHSYGHTHGYERGTWETTALNPRGDFRIVCGGGGGGPTDRWGVYQNNDFSNVHVTLDHYFYQIIEIDPANKTYESKMYSLGNSSKARDNEVMDTWYRKANQPAPAEPVTNPPTIDSSKITFNTSEISGDSLMTVRIQVSQNENFSSTVIDTMINWKNIYKADANYDPIDLNAGIDLTKLSFPSSRFINGELYYYRVKYRDHNVKWTGWSNVTAFNFVTGVEDDVMPKVYELSQNYPNPFNPITTINYQVPKESFVTLRVFDILGNQLAELVHGYQGAGNYTVSFPPNNLKLASGTYFYQLRAGDFVNVKKMLFLK
jgi:guanyl-specific ribonuclease Sa